MYFAQLRQWDAVEEAACEVARKRTRGNATLGIQGPAKVRPHAFLLTWISCHLRGTSCSGDTGQKLM
jgi:hypothetical protein